ncbi:MAG: AsmA family protein [Streptomyces sp.]|nr:AsmA family protein [Streptomyces sp.]
MLVVLAVVIIATYDWNRLKPTINDKVSQAVGRPFAIQGDLSVAWRREPGAGRRPGRRGPRQCPYEWRPAGSGRRGC